MRSRIIRPAFFKSEAVCKLSYPARLLFIGLWTMADREGRLVWRTPVVHGALFPTDDDADVMGWLNEAIGQGLLLPYLAGDDRLLEVPGLRANQGRGIHGGEPASMLRPFPGDGEGWGSEHVTPLVSALVTDGGDTLALSLEGSHLERADRRQAAAFATDSPEYRLAVMLRACIASHSDRHVKAVDEGRLQAWSKTFDLLLRRDAAEPREVALVMRWAHCEDPSGFWRSNLLSASSVRKHFPRLSIQRANVKGAIPAGARWLDIHAKVALRYRDRHPRGPWTSAGLIAECTRADVPPPPEVNRVLEWIDKRTRA